MTAVINIRHDRSVLGEPDVVRIDRATQWGNPFVIGRDGDRAEVIAKYRAWLWREIGDGRISGSPNSRRLTASAWPAGARPSPATATCSPRPRAGPPNNCAPQETEMTARTPDILDHGATRRARLRHARRGAAHPAALRRGALGPRPQPPRAALRLPVRLPHARSPRAGFSVPAVGRSTWPGGCWYSSTACLPAQCIVNEYLPGQGIGMHADHRDFGAVVASLSLADDWPMRFRPRNTRPYVRHGVPGDRVLTLPRRSVLVLSGPARQAWMHGIDPSDTANRRVTRVSATFRTLAG